MTDKALKTYQTEVKETIITTLKEYLEAPDDDDGNPDWSAYDGLVDNLNIKISDLSTKLVSNIAAAQPKVSNKSSKTKVSGETKRKNSYTQWVRLASQIRKGESDLGNLTFTVTENFRDKATASAVKYFGAAADLDLVGKTMSVVELLETLKQGGGDQRLLADEKDLTLTAICWGLMPVEFRESLVSEQD